MKTCFSIMPFKTRFNGASHIIKTAAKRCGLSYERGDFTKKSGNILAHIVNEISHAAVVVADITDLNPNVLYELGIAHQLLGPERVVILSQRVYGSTELFDVTQFRMLVYGRDKQGLAKLRAELPGRVAEAAKSNADHEHWRVVRGRLARTKMIVQDLKRLVEQAGKGKHSLNGVTIRTVASLSSLAISDHEPHDSSDREYMECLLEERNFLRAALLLGARLKAVLNPPRRFANSLKTGHLEKRYQRLIGLLRNKSDCETAEAAKQDKAAIKRCEFTFSPVPMPNLFIIGNSIVYEGMKRAGAGGFEMTHWETSPDELRQMCEQFDDFFANSKRDMTHMHPGVSVADQLQEFYDEARAVRQRRRATAKKRKRR
jgi:hypothetical protein